MRRWLRLRRMRRAFRAMPERDRAIFGSVRFDDRDYVETAELHGCTVAEVATGRTAEALEAYRQQDALHLAETREAARAALIERWNRRRHEAPSASRIILTHTNDEVAALNRAARDRLRAHGELGEDVTWQVEKGERQFAAGDRVMFGRNERSLGVKNGSLGRIESVTATRMAVLLDNGGSVAFDLKDYTAVDHGYAATVHKAQGVTVDEVHVLATPGLDRHAAYVALSRHRERVNLHYGRDDFSGHATLAAALSRERGKDMASDYAPEFAARRQIVLPPSVPAPQPAPKRDMFAGLKLRVSPAVPPPAQPLAHKQAPQPEPVIVPTRAVQRHATIVRAMNFAQRVGDQHTAEQRQELQASRAALNALAPYAVRDLELAFSNDPSLIREASEGQVARSIRAMRFEEDIRVDPQLRADAFVQRWQALDRQRRLLLRNQETTDANRVADRMIGMAKSLERDPQVESILRNRKAQLGLPEMPGRSVGQSLADLIGRSRSRGLNIGM